MDTTDTYIRMCEGAWSDLARPLRVDDVVFSRSRFQLCRVTYSLDARARLKLCCVVFDGCLLIEADDFIIVWRQDQLQGIVTMANPQFHPFNLLWRFFRFAHGNVDVQIDGWAPIMYKVTSMEQLWLAFVMKELYNKVWNGEEWL